MGITVIKKPPWEMGKMERERYKHGDRKVQAKILDRVKMEKKRWAGDGKWKRWEDGRKKALRERRDYFRNNPDRHDDFSGV